ncbi:hypothetical protein GCM10010276_89760 [Streptomyces longisporus]|uniref:Uncharacterized protein n=1 Tax=Streptomyces longisporus TaxID=1948 RepID=A0ABN3NJW2_STRLO
MAGDPLGDVAGLGQKLCHIFIFAGHRAWRMVETWFAVRLDVVAVAVPNGDGNILTARQRRGCSATPSSGGEASQAAGHES